MALNIQRGVIWKPQKVVIYGPEGIGKSTFAAQFPEPLFIDTEGSTNLLNVARLPRPTSWTMLLDYIREVRATKDCCKTLVIDTMDWAEQLCVAHICATHNKKGVEDFGYGKGYVFVKEEIGRFLNLLTEVIEAGINVVLTAHSQIRKFELPDECGSYDRYELKLGNKTGGQTSALVKEWADMVLFANYKQHVVEVNEKKKAQGGKRVMNTTHHPCWDAKNRHDLKPELPFDFAEIAYCIPDGQKNEAIEAISVPAPSKPDVELAQVREENNQAIKQPAPAKEEKKESPAPEPIPAKEAPAAGDDLAGLPKSLVDLMKANGVVSSQIQTVVAMKGYYPGDTPIKNYDPGFIDGVLVGAWEQVYGMIKEIPFK